MNRWKTVIVVSLALLLAAAGGVIWLARSPRVVRSFALPDGTTMSLYKVTYGTNHEAIYATDWRDRFARFVPERLATNWGFKRMAYYPSTALSSNSNNLVVWMKRSGLMPATAPTPGSRGVAGPRMRATVVDENGLEATTTMSSWNGTFMALLLPNYPRRSHVIHLRFWDASTPVRGGAVQPLLAELAVPNPAPSTAVPWMAEPLPAVRVTNGLEISLLSLETGHSAAGAGLRSGGFGGGAPAADARTYSLARVELRENGRPATAWNVRGFRAAAPTGVSLIMRGSSRSTSAGADDYSFAGVLWPEEPVWDLTIELARQSVFPAEETWKITGIPVPRIGESNANAVVPIETNMFGEHLVFLGLSLRQAMALSFLSGSNTPSLSPVSWTLNLTVANYSSDVQLGLLWLRTDTGQTIHQNGSSSSVPAPRAGVIPTATYGFDYVVPDGAATLDATFTVSRVRTATFRVKPTLAH